MGPQSLICCCALPAPHLLNGTKPNKIKFTISEGVKIAGISIIRISQFSEVSFLKMSIKYINDATQKLQNIMKKEKNYYDDVCRTKMDVNKWPCNVEVQHDT